MRKISKKQFDRIITALLGTGHNTMTGITHVTLKRGKCSTVDGQWYADSKALELIGVAPKRTKRRSY